MSGHVAIVLAAGRGQRMGGPKALLLIGGKPLVLRHVDELLASGAREVVIVTNADVAERLVPVDDRIRLVVSGEAQQSGSLAVGVRAAAAASRVLVTTVDALPPALVTYAALLAALERGARAATPVDRASGRGGHPVACRATVLAPFRQGEAGAAPPLRDVLAALGPDRVRLEVDDRNVAVDLDTADDVRALTGAAPVFWRGET